MLKLPPGKKLGPPGSYVPPEFSGGVPLVVAPDGKIAPAPPPDKPRFPPFFSNQLNGTLNPALYDWPWDQLLGDSMLFYDIQRSGPIEGVPGGNRIPWRKNHLLTDGADVDVNLTGGHYEAGSAHRLCPGLYSRPGKQSSICIAFLGSRDP
jgi:hypothetical protein